MSPSRQYAASEPAWWQVKAIQEVAARVEAEADPRRGLRRLIEHSIDFVGPSSAAIALLQKTRAEFRFEVAIGLPEALADRVFGFDEGIAGQAAMQRAAVVTENVPDSALGFSTTDQDGFRAAAAFPLLAHGDVIGVLVVAKREQPYFDPTSLSLLEMLANRLGSAVGYARLLLEMERTNFDLTRGFGRVDEMLLSGADVETVLRAITELAVSILGVDAVHCSLIEEGRQAISVGAGPAAPSLLALERAAHLSARIYEHEQPFHVDDLEANTATPNQNPLRAYLGVPMSIQGRVIGTFAVARSNAGYFSTADVQLLRSLAGQAAVAISHARLYHAVNHDRQRLQAIFDNISDGIVIVDRDRRILAYNQAMESLIGWKPNEAIGTRCEELYGCYTSQGNKLCKVACPVIHAIQARTQIPYFETRISARDGSFRDVAIGYSFIPDPGDARQVCGVAVVRDITHMKQVEEAKSQFLSAVSHELRTPLSSIKASVGILLANTVWHDNDPFQRLLRNIDRSADRLIRQVSDLLDLARLQSGRITLNTKVVDLREVGVAAIATFRPLAEEKQQIVRWNEPPFACLASVDRDRVEQILLNLLSNANKYAPAGTQIDVELVDEGDLITFSVRDQGPGIPISEQGLIFERFYRREDEETQRNIGTGLGLAVARALVELHKGRIGVNSVPGTGSTFWFSVPKEGAVEDSRH